VSPYKDDLYAAHKRIEALEDEIRTSKEIAEHKGPSQMWSNVKDFFYRNKVVFIWVLIGLVAMGLVTYLVLYCENIDKERINYCTKMCKDKFPKDNIISGMVNRTDGNTNGTILKCKCLSSRGVKAESEFYFNGDL